MVRAIAYLLVKSLGFETISASTANWAGRIDHFLVFKNQLFLFKIEASLRPEDKDISPPDARRETRLIYELMTSYEGSEEKEIIRVHQYQYFISDDLRINFTGELELSQPSWRPVGLSMAIERRRLRPNRNGLFSGWLANEHGNM